MPALEAAALTAVQVAASGALQSALASAVGTIARRVWATQTPSKRRDRRRQEQLTAILADLDFSRRIALSPILEALPTGMSVREVELLLESPEVRGAIHELVAARIFAPTGDHHSVVRETFTITFEYEMVRLGQSADAKLGLNRIRGS